MLIESSMILQDSVFSLCPSGSSSNSAWLWESIGFGAIPIIFGDTINLPGKKALWEEAVVLCPERKEDILVLPNRLRSMVRDEVLLERKRCALRQLWLLYGPDCLIYDIQKLFLSLAQENVDESNTRPGFSYGRLLTMASAINHCNDSECNCNQFILGCSSRVLSDPSGFQNCYKSTAEFRKAYKSAMNNCNRQYSEKMQLNLKFKNIVLG